MATDEEKKGMRIWTNKDLRDGYNKGYNQALEDVLEKYKYSIDWAYMKDLTDGLKRGAEE